MNEAPPSYLDHVTTRLGRVLLLEQVLSIRVPIYRGAADVEPGLDSVLTQKPFDPNLNFCLLHMQNSAKWTVWYRYQVLDWVYCSSCCIKHSSKTKEP